LGYGTFLYVDHLKVGQEWRRIGLGTKLVKELMEFVGSDVMSRSEVSRAPEYAFVLPHFLPERERSFFVAPTAAEQEEWVNGKKASTRLFRRIGFRRVGLSPFLALALQNKDHASRALQMEDDCDEK